MKQRAWISWSTAIVIVLSFLGLSLNLQPVAAQSDLSTGPAVKIDWFTGGAATIDPTTGMSVNQVKPGDPVTYLYEVTNTGSVPFNGSDVKVSDDQNSVLTRGADLVGNDDNTLDPGEVWVYEASGAALVSGSNTATVTIGALTAQTVNCYNKDLTITKTATTSFIRTYNWTIEKSADLDQINTADSATFNYTVKVTKDAGADSAWVVSGKITVSNPNAFAVSGVTVTDATTGGDCKVTGGTNLTVPANGSKSVDYSCTFQTKPSYNFNLTNKATVTWNKTTYDTPNGSACVSVTYKFTAPTTLVNDSIHVTDTNSAAPGQPWTFNTSGTKTYPVTYTDPAGTCTTHDNVATITETGQSAKKTVKVCVGKDLTVSKTAVSAFTRTYAWDISKAVDKNLIEQSAGFATFNYTVHAWQTGFADSAWALTGKITVTNPNDWESVTFDATDALAGCSVTDGTGIVLAAGASKDLDYTCSFDAIPADLNNVATASWDKAAAYTPNGSASSAPVAFAFTSPTALEKQIVHVTDTFNGVKTDLGTLTATDVAPWASATYAYPRTLTVPTSECVANNTASIVETQKSASQTVRVALPGVSAGDAPLCISTDVSIIKKTNGPGGEAATASDPNGSDVPNIEVGKLVTWTYIVMNTGKSPVDFKDVVVTDNQPNVKPVFEKVLVGASSSTFNPGDVWQYTANGIAIDLKSPASDVRVKLQSCTHGGTQTARTAYVNIGTVTIPTGNAQAQSSYCNPTNVGKPTTYHLYFPMGYNTTPVKDTLITQWQMGLGYEDLPLGDSKYGRNDYDYNDWVVAISGNLNYESASANLLKSISMSFTPKARGAAFDHQFSIHLAANVFKSNGVAVLTTYDQNHVKIGTPQTTTFVAGGNTDFVIFNSTKEVFPGSIVNTREGDAYVKPQRFVDLVITFDNTFAFTITQADLGLAHGKGLFYDPFLKVSETGESVHIGDVRLLSVPTTDWLWPEERVRIDSVYPDVTYIDSGLGDFNFPSFWWTKHNHCAYDGVLCGTP